jgi:hypothetical protein
MVSAGSIARWNSLRRLKLKSTARKADSAAKNERRQKFGSQFVLEFVDAALYAASAVGYSTSESDVAIDSGDCRFAHDWKGKALRHCVDLRRKQLRWIVPQRESGSASASRWVLSCPDFCLAAYETIRM